MGHRQTLPAYVYSVAIEEENRHLRGACFGRIIGGVLQARRSSERRMISYKAYTGARHRYQAVLEKTAGGNGFSLLCLHMSGEYALYAIRNHQRADERGSTFLCIDNGSNLSSLAKIVGSAAATHVSSYIFMHCRRAKAGGRK